MIKDKITKISFKYKQFVNGISAKLKSGKLNEKQKIKIFFFVKGEEIKNMTPKDLQRAHKKYIKILASVEETIDFLSKKKDRVRNQGKMQERISLEKYAKKHCGILVKKIEKKLVW